MKASAQYKKVNRGALQPNQSSPSWIRQWFVARGAWLAVVLGFVVTAALLAIALPLRADVDRPAHFPALRWWIEPLETNAFIRRPAISRGLYSLAVAPDGRTALAVGDRGTLLRSTDGGFNWVQLETDELGLMTAVALNGRVGFVVGTGGMLLRTADGGATWIRGNSTTEADLYAIAIAPNGTFVLAAGDNDTLLRSTDGGATWMRTKSDTAAGRLLSLAIGADGQVALAAGQDVLLRSVNGGTTWTGVDQTGGEAIAVSTNGRTAVAGGLTSLLLSVNGGATWTKHDPDPLIDIASTLAVVIAPNEHNLLAAGGVGGAGTVIRSSDQGKRWTEIVRSRKKLFRALAITPDGLTVLAAGDSGILMRSPDGGLTWKQLTLHRRRPAPVMWVALLLAFVAAPALFTPLPQEKTKLTVGTLSDIFATDRPLQDNDADVAGAGAMATRLSQFLRNRRTQPPLTLAVTGAWGSGKSSVLNRLADDLRLHGIRPVLFNAWHHQKEEQLFVALLQAVREQAVPPAHTVGGLVVRWRLFTARLKKRWVLWVLIAVLTAFAMGALWTVRRGHLDSLWGFLHVMLSDAKPSAKPSGVATLETETTIPTAIKTLGTVATIVFVALNSLMLFRDRLKDSGLDPGRLMAAAAGATRWRDLGGQLAFRVRFADALKEATDALGNRTLTLLIDDLDRCDPMSVADVMEAVNFLTSASGCFVVLAIAPDQVLKAMGLAHSEMAKEMAPSNITDERAARDRYARLYIEKLIQIEVPVPPFDANAASKLVAGALALPKYPAPDRAWVPVAISLL